jgi:hypothetical protein
VMRDLKNLTLMLLMEISTDFKKGSLTCRCTPSVTLHLAGIASLVLRSLLTLSNLRPIQGGWQARRPTCLGSRGLPGEDLLPGAETALGRATLGVTPPSEHDHLQATATVGCSIAVPLMRFLPLQRSGSMGSTVPGLASPGAFRLQVFSTS